LGSWVPALTLREHQTIAVAARLGSEPTPAELVTELLEVAIQGTEEVDMGGDIEGNGSP